MFFGSWQDEVQLTSLIFSHCWTAYDTDLKFLFDPCFKNVASVFGRLKSDILRFVNEKGLFWKLKSWSAQLHICITPSVCCPISVSLKTIHIFMGNQYLKGYLSCQELTSVVYRGFPREPKGFLFCEGLCYLFRDTQLKTDRKLSDKEYR